MPYYPETSVIQGLTRISRERRLPNGAAPAPVQTSARARVEAITPVLEGDLLREYRVFDVGEALGLRSRDPETLRALVEVEEGQRVQAEQALARRGRGRRTRYLQAPGEGIVARVEGGRIVLQVMERTVEVLARIPGEVDEVEPHRVVVVGQGAVMQCAWGNGGFAFENYRFAPEGGLSTLSKTDARISEYRGVVVISPNPLDRGDLNAARQHGVGGVVAPSMPADLREFAKTLPFPVMLTEGFGKLRPTALIYTLLHSNLGRQAAFDAALPDRGLGDRPEIFIPLPAGGRLPPVAALDRALGVGDRVRVARGAQAGMIGEVVELPKAPQRVESGLRVASARVRLHGERDELVPLANLELLG